MDVQQVKSREKKWFWVGEKKNSTEVVDANHNESDTNIRKTENFENDELKNTTDSSNCDYKKVGERFPR